MLSIDLFNIWIGFSKNLVRKISKLNDGKLTTFEISTPYFSLYNERAFNTASNKEILSCFDYANNSFKASQSFMNVISFHLGLYSLVLPFTLNISQNWFKDRGNNLQLSKKVHL